MCSNTKTNPSAAKRYGRAPEVRGGTRPAADWGSGRGRGGDVLYRWLVAAAAAVRYVKTSGRDDDDGRAREEKGVGGGGKTPAAV